PAAGPRLARLHGRRCRLLVVRVRLPGLRPAPLRMHRIPRFPRRAGHRLAGRRDYYRRQPLGRSSLRRDRPADPIPMSTASAPLSPSASPSRAASLTLAWRFAAFHVGGFPVLPTLILLVLAFTAVFANVIAPSDPEIRTLGERFRPPARQTARREKYLLGTDHLARDVHS